MRATSWQRDNRLAGYFVPSVAGFKIGAVDVTLCLRRIAYEYPRWIKSDLDPHLSWAGRMCCLLILGSDSRKPKASIHSTRHGAGPRQRYFDVFFWLPLHPPTIECRTRTGSRARNSDRVVIAAVLSLCYVRARERGSDLLRQLCCCRRSPRAYLAPPPGKCRARPVKDFCRWHLCLLASVRSISAWNCLELLSASELRRSPWVGDKPDTG
ncbi:hypothetical protein B0T16DRAFT_19947 [Cercophora newfieldiana]|uniref:Uncharacterized protein n=1 Tax=Cercophora newfieldiana TaxID=92897 RepID=A0AA39YNQ7_9PEZI|nr:hypothetical protein B0T16DRAFT_19947 [Cercophora newfieldiana]